MSEQGTSYNRPKDVDFGLANIHLKPLSKKKETVDLGTSFPNQIAVPYPKKGVETRAMIIGLIILLIVIAAGVYYAYDQGYLFQPKQELSNANIPPAIPENETENTDEVSGEDRIDNEVFIPSDSIEGINQVDSLNKKEVVTPEMADTDAPKLVLTEFTNPTGKYHIIIASVPSVELARVDGNKLLASDVSIAILYPRADRNENFRLSAASFATLDEATNQLNFYRQKYGESVWVLRY
jgi:hypothetical protein